MYDQKYAKQLCNLLQERFYQSKPWRVTRKHALMIYGAKCHCCGTVSSKRKPLHVDHIKPRSKHPELALCMTNLQVLCERCNSSKSNTHESDYRSVDDRAYASMYHRGANVRTILLEQKKNIVAPRGLTASTPPQLKVEQKIKQQNPNTVKDARTKKQKRKQHSEFIKTQQLFLETVRTMTTTSEVTAFVEKCKDLLGVDVTNRLVGLCNVSHKLDR